ncbi:MAG TPA: phosphatidate cytidylyltransferase [Candidatus Binatia bacterium]|nr:phosphatidate cytidylyltransferase [Candidatus Binatia bacterium]
MAGSGVVDSVKALHAPRGHRLIIGLALAVFGLGSVFYAPAFTLVVVVIATASLWEFAELSARKGTTLDYPVALVAVVAYLLLTSLGLIHRWEGVLLAATVIVALGRATLSSRGGYLARSGYTLLGVLYIGKLLSYFLTIRSVPALGIPLTLYAVVLIAMTDIFCMVIGVLFGRRPLTTISPRKTVEGALGGLAVATLCGIAFAVTPALHLAWWQGALIGILTSIAAQAGDLVESALKRDARVKDAGSAIGGHGGVLDRFDSYIFGGVAFYFALYLIGVVPVR